MTSVRDNLCSLNPVQIPRPKCQGFQWVQTRGRQGFYKSIRANGEKYGLAIKPQGPRRPMLHDSLFRRPETVKEEENDGTFSPPQPNFRQNRGGNSTDTDRSSNSSQLSSDGSRRSSPDPEPDYPSDYVPPQLPPPRVSPPRLSHSSAQRF